MQLLLLHGAIGSSIQLQPLAEKLKEQFTVHTLNFSGHGGKELPADNFSIRLFADDVLEWMEKNSIPNINIFGYSMGGYVGLYLARHHPEKINKVFTLATKFNWTPESAQRDVKMLDPDLLTEKLPGFAATLAKRHSPTDWIEILRKTQSMMLNMAVNYVLTKEDFQKIEQPVLLAIGEQDKMVSIAETENVCGQIRNAKMLVLTDTKHPIEGLNIDTISGHINTFFRML